MMALQNQRAAAASHSNTATLEPTNESGCLDPTAADSEAATGAPAMRRLLHLQLAQLGLAHSATDDDRIVIAGRSFDLRGARAYVRLMGGRP